MILQIEIDGERLELLNDIVAAVNAENNPTQTTPVLYAENIVAGWLDERIRSEYEQHVRRQPVAALRQKLGPRKEL